MSKFTVEFYEDIHGNKPIEDFLLALDIKMRAKILGRKIILTNGFIKKTQKAPAREIQLAKKRRNEYIERKQSR